MSSEQENHDELEVYAHIDGVVRWVTRVFVVLLLFPVLLYIGSRIDFQKKIEEVKDKTEESIEIENGIEVESGLIVAEGYELVKITCGACHSLELVTQNSATREGWKDIIVWMQQTQKLWDLGENEALILDYLEKNYAPKEQGRRAPLKNVDWYEL